MRRLLAAALVLFILAPTGQAKPWYKSRRVWTVVAISVAGAGAATYEAHRCRAQFGPAPCAGGYGPAKALEGLRLGVTGGLDVVALELRHDHDKLWPLMPLGLAAFNTGVAVQQSRVRCPRHEEFCRDR